ncbi:MAG: hemerythrin family protein [Firmicutes bacterium]|jgi:hemerythrin|nr:hemerythrin family protein [Bacillota bacterium]
MAIQWTPALAVGIDAIDGQHKTLFQKVNNLIEACNRGQGKDTVAQTIDFLGEYVIIHFRDEEKLMQKHSFPGYLQHKQLHDAFIKGFQQLKDELEEEGPGLGLVLKTNRLVVDWLINHISKKDKAFGKFLRGEG